MDADGGSSCAHIVRYERTEKPELWDQNLNGLQIFILPMNLLKAQDIVIPGQSLDVMMFSFPGGL